MRQRRALGPREVECIGFFWVGVVWGDWRGGVIGWVVIGEIGRDGLAIECCFQLQARLASRISSSSSWSTEHANHARFPTSPTSESAYLTNPGFSPSANMTTPTSPDPSQPPPQTTPSDNPPQQRLPNFLPNDPARTNYNPTAPWWLNYFRILSGTVTREGIEHFREDRFAVNESRDCARCEEYRDYLLSWSPTVRFLREKIEALGGRLDATNIVCRRCPGKVATDGSVARQAGGFSPSHGILLCANAVRSRGHLEDTLAHEMVHAWDHLRWKVDWRGGRDLRHSACTEVSLPCLGGGWFGVGCADLDYRFGRRCSVASAGGRGRRLHGGIGR